jgi:hypothetical protein
MDPLADNIGLDKYGSQQINGETGQWRNPPNPPVAH